MSFQYAPLVDPARTRCVRHGCPNPAVWTVASTRWWRMRDKGADDGRTGIVFECCEACRGVGWKRRP